MNIDYMYCEMLQQTQTEVAYNFKISYHYGVGLTSIDVTFLLTAIKIAFLISYLNFRYTN